MMDTHSFEGGPPLKLERWLGITKPSDNRVCFRAVAVVLVGWLPLAVLAAVQEITSGNGSLQSFLLDSGPYARLLFAAPLFIVAEPVCFSGFRIALNYFSTSGIVRIDDRERYNAQIVSTVRLLNSTWVEIVVAALAILAAASMYVSLNPANLSIWQQTTGSYSVIYSPAAKWHAFVSTPLLLMLVLGWVWRLLLWSVLLSRIARLDLYLIASHPDRRGGLEFLGSVVAGYLPLAFATSLMVAGTAFSNVHRGSGLFDAGFLAAAMLALALLLFVAPFGVFSPRLFRLKERGIREYGALGRALGEKFEMKWMRSRKPMETDALQAPDFSATTDLYQTVEIVHQITLFPIGRKLVGRLILAAIAPFIPLALFDVPLKVLLERLVRLLF
jgi:hypothetical protein